MLELDLTTIIFEIVNFLILTALLYRFLFQPVLQNVRARAAEKERLSQVMAQAQHAAQQAQAEWEARLAQADEDIARKRDQARWETVQARDRTLQQTQAEVERILAEAHLEGQQSQQQALTQFHDRIVQTILETSGWLMGRVAPPELHDRLVKQLSDHIWRMGQDGMQQVELIRRSLKDRQPTVSITTPRPLLVEQQRQLLQTLTALADCELKPEVQIDPTLVAGLQIRLGDMVLDNSLAGELANLRDEASSLVKNEFLSEKRVIEAETLPENVGML